MSDKISNAYDYQSSLETNEGATAAAVEILAKACEGSSEGTNIALIRCAIKEDFIKELRDKIKESAVE